MQRRVGAAQPCLGAGTHGLDQAVVTGTALPKPGFPAQPHSPQPACGRPSPQRICLFPHPPAPRLHSRLGPSTAPQPSWPQPAASALHRSLLGEPRGRQWSWTGGFLCTPSAESEQDLPRKQNRIPLTGTTSRDSDSSARGLGEQRRLTRDRSCTATHPRRCGVTFTELLWHRDSSLAGLSPPKHRSLQNAASRTSPGDLPCSCVSLETEAGQELITLTNEGSESDKISFGNRTCVLGNILNLGKHQLMEFLLLTG
nr:uncharacterized protein LOC129395071 [Pan paniscus]